MTCRSSREPRSGKVLVLLAFSLIAVVGAVALAADGGLMLDNRRQVQSAADAAALAAAIDLFTNYQTNQGTDPQGTAAARAQEAASAQGFTNGVNGVSVQVNIPPQSGDHVGLAGHAEVIVNYPQPRYFGGVFGSSATNISARAVARGRLWRFQTGILVLDLTASESLKVNGTGSVYVNGADVIVNSTNSQAVGGDGQGTTLTDVGGAFDLSGGIKTNTNIAGTINYNRIPTPDPLAYLPEPSLPSVSISVKGMSPNSSAAQPYLQALNLTAKQVNGQVYVLDPGRYDNLPNFTNGDVVILKQASDNSSQQGVYYLNGSGFTTNGATVVMDPTGATTGGLMLFNNPGNNSNSSGISISGGVVNLAPPTSGTYQGISIFQTRSATQTMSITGQGGTQITGTFYVPNASMQITGSSTTTLDVIGSQYISDTLQAGGNGTYAVNWDPNKTAPLRQLGLVE
jgi:hypothetical protein